MDTSLRTKGMCVFGRFQLDTTRRSLVRDGEAIVLSSRVFDVLCYMVENPGRVIEKDELLNAVWAGRYVEEANLSQTVFLLRKALKEAGEADSLISTVSGRGYCFTGSVLRDSGSGPPAAGAVPQSAGTTPSSIASDLASSRGSWTRWRFALIAAAVALATCIAVVLVLPRMPRRPQQSAFRPPPHSVAVLPFANMSGDPRQEYLADGFSEELIDALNNVNSLRVVDRTSSFYFGGHPAPLAEIARRLNVGAVLEGSIRRDGRHLRITVALINAASGFRFWTHSYDRDFSDILKLQREIAETVTRSLLATLQAGTTMQMPMGGTNDSSAFDAYLRGLQFMTGRDESSYRSALAAFDEAFRRDPHFAGAQVMRAIVLMFLAAIGTAIDPSVRDTQLEALDAANRAVALAPGWGRSYSARGAVLLTLLDLAGAEREFLHARGLAPGDVNIDRPYAFLESYLGHAAAAEAAAARVVARYPVDGNGYWDQARVLYFDRRYQEALAASRHGGVLHPTEPPGDEATSALAWLALGKVDTAARICAPNRAWQETVCLAITAHRLGKVVEAEARLASLRASLGDRGAYQFAEIYAQWGAPENALAWLRTACRLRDTGLSQLKVDPLMDPIRATPGFADIEHCLNFPPVSLATKFTPRLVVGSAQRRGLPAFAEGSPRFGGCVRLICRSRRLWSGSIRPPIHWARKKARTRSCSPADRGRYAVPS